VEQVETGSPHLFLQTIWADSVRDGSATVHSIVNFDGLPVFLIVANFLAPGTDRKQTFHLGDNSSAHPRLSSGRNEFAIANKILSSLNGPTPAWQGLGQPARCGIFVPTDFTRFISRSASVVPFVGLLVTGLVGR
jgi:hypothetical protein